MTCPSTFPFLSYHVFFIHIKPNKWCTNSLAIYLAMWQYSWNVMDTWARWWNSLLKVFRNSAASIFAPLLTNRWLLHHPSWFLCRKFITNTQMAPLSEGHSQAPRWPHCSKTDQCPCLPVAMSSFCYIHSTKGSGLPSSIHCVKSYPCPSDGMFPFRWPLHAFLTPRCIIKTRLLMYVEYVSCNIHF